MSSNADRNSSRGVADTSGSHPSRSSSSIASSSRLPPLSPEPEPTTDKKRHRESGTPEESSYGSEQSSSQRQRLNDGSRRNRSTVTEASAAARADNIPQADAHTSVGSSSSGQQPYLSYLPPANPPSLPLSPNPPSQSSSTSPPRVRRPPVSQSAWSALRERMGSSSSTLYASRPSLPLSGAERVLPSPDVPGQSTRQETDAFPRSPGIPVDHSAARSSTDPVVAGNPPRPATQPSSSRWGPGAVVGALMSDILGFTARTGNALPGPGPHARPAQVNPGTSTTSTSAPAPVPRPPVRPPYHRGWPTMAPPPPFTPPGGSRPTNQAAVPARFFGLGGTSIIVQGAMVARLNRTEVESTGGTANSEATAGPRNEFAPVDGGIGSERSSRYEAPETSDANTGTNIPTWGDAQASMLTRLLSIAAAATASSLVSPPAVSAVGVRAELANPPGLPADGLRAQRSQMSAGISAGAFHPPTSASGGGGGSEGVMPSWVSHQRGEPHNSSRLRRSIASLTSRVFGRFSSQQGLDQTRLPGDGAAQTSSTAGITNTSDDEANEVDSSLGAGSRSYPAGRDHNGSSTNNTDDSDARRALSMSEMLQEAMREGNAPDTASSTAANGSSEPRAATAAGVNNANAARTATAAPVPPQPSPAAYLAGVLTAARENRLQRGPEGSFERWLYDLSDDLDHAVRTMITTQVSQGSLNATAVGVDGEDSDLAGTNDSDHRHSDQGAQSRRALDVEQGQLSFFRLFRLDGRGPQPSTTNHTSTTASGPASAASSASELPPRNEPGLVPCVVVGVRSLSMTTQPITPQHAVERFRGLLAGTPTDSPAGHVHEQSTERNDGTTTSTTSEDGSSASRSDDRPSRDQSTATSANQSQGSPATADVERGTSAEQNDSSRFLLFVSGGFYPPAHPLLSTPSNVAARDLMLLIEVLSNLNSANTANAASDQSARVSKEDLERSGPSVKKWMDIKASAVEVDAKEGTKTGEGGKGQLAPRAGDRCAICLEEWLDEDDVRILGCRHAYHQGCVDQWLLSSSNSCPMCRQIAVGKNGRDSSTATGQDSAGAAST
ncbi:hypothetical protein BCV69DRAFT_281602 [Microstroma glucosiphilum]|uniref:RING-type domain-containing protein n=1 Tax=Pseudomicrostroma glucosiphilum TaxID=1684307 RepID=A0A316UA20_9BASI|nr:hypothetical protein BCV69DRAFT_281602 [Pseudomicrostroma glucosiphilum]PWN21664.1 hypothetical protein BCV69DRAFT_281602 [Pseudomicrostroma glucosiphilum]